MGVAERRVVDIVAKTLVDVSGGDAGMNRVIGQGGTIIGALQIQHK